MHVSVEKTWIGDKQADTIVATNDFDDFLDPQYPNLQNPGALFQISMNWPKNGFKPSISIPLN